MLAKADSAFFEAPQQPSVEEILARAVVRGLLQIAEQHSHNVDSRHRETTKHLVGLLDHLADPSFHPGLDTKIELYDYLHDFPEAQDVLRIANDWAFGPLST